MTKILITGSQGQLAYELVQLANQHQVIALTHQQLDIINQTAVQQAFDIYQPNIVINTAAYTQVDLAEQNSEQAYAVNCTGAKNLAIACAETHIPLLHLSTDYVFNGTKNSPYQETDPVSPINTYGLTKWQGEEAIRTHCSQHIILRVSSVFGRHGQNFVKTILRLAQEKETLRIVADQIMCPTPAYAIAETLLKTINKPQWGTYHYCGSEPATWYDFANLIVQFAKEHTQLRVKQIEPITAADFPTAAKRPAYSVLDCSQFEKNFNIKRPHWQTGLKNVITALSTP